MKGQEVTLADDELRKIMKTDKPSFGIHAISWGPPTDGSDGSGSEMNELVDDSTDDSDHLIEDSSESDDQKVHEVVSLKVRRTRAAPFFDEMMPGWRARAREIVPSHHSKQCDPKSIPCASNAGFRGRRQDKEVLGISGLEESQRPDEKGSGRDETGGVRERSQARDYASESDEDEEARVGRSSSKSAV